MANTSSDINFAPIRVSTLRGDQKIDFDVYISINDKMILYVKKGDSFEGDRLTRLRSKKLKKMFIQPDDEANYRNYLFKNIEMAYDSKSGKSIENRSAIVHGAQQSSAEAVMENPEDADIYAEAKETVGKFAEFLKNESEAFSNIMAIENTDQNIAHHGASVAALSVSLARKLGYSDQKQMQLLALGSLLHDIEHSSSGLNIARPLSQLSPDELAFYKEHPQLGGQRVQDKKHFDSTVINIITQHEELANGAGFPMGLTEKKIDPMALIVGTCNALDRLISFEGVPRKGAARHLIINGMGKYPLQHMQLLSEIMSSVK